MHKDQQRKSFLWILESTTFISPKGESPKIPIIQKSIVWNVASMIFKRAKNQLSRMNCSYTFFSTTCTKDFGLDWGDFAKFHKLLYSTVAMHEHVIAKFRNLLHFLDSWVIYKEKKAYPWWGHNTFHQLVWRLD
jgi:hypothetical protein